MRSFGDYLATYLAALHLCNAWRAAKNIANNQAINVTGMFQLILKASCNARLNFLFNPKL